MSKQIEKSKQEGLREHTESEGKSLTPKETRFCYEFCVDLNATQAAIRAGYSPKTARTIGSRLLTKVDIQKKICAMQENLSETAGITALRVLLEHKKIAFNSISGLHNTWIERKDFESLSEDQKACISEISTQTRDVKNGDDIIEVQFIKIKLHDKQKALDSISKMLGYNAPEKTEITGRNGKELFAKMTDEDLKDILDKIRNKSSKQE